MHRWPVPKRSIEWKSVVHLLIVKQAKETTDFMILYYFKGYKLRLLREEILVTASKMVNNGPEILIFLFLSELGLLTLFKYKL